MSALKYNNCGKKGSGTNSIYFERDKRTGQI